MRSHAPAFIIAASAISALLAASAAAAGLLWPQHGAPYEFMTLRGAAASIFGQGLYRFDTVFAAAGYKGQDFVVLLLAAPATFAALWRTIRCFCSTLLRSPRVSSR